MTLSVGLACTVSVPTESSALPTVVPPPVEQVTVVSPNPVLLPASISDTGDLALITRVIDGDTIEVSFHGDLQTIRYIGIDTPETKHPSKPIECFGPEASRFNEKLVGGREVVLEKDITDKDRYGRLLRYVWTEGVGLVNLVLVENGYAQVSTYPPDVKYKDGLVAAEASAQASAIGLWGACNELKSSVIDKPNITPIGSPGTDCSPHYPTVCIPPFPPDLDCHEINEANFQVLPPDPHSLDGNLDGIGCER